jgi:hypothetical protein
MSNYSRRIFKSVDNYVDHDNDNLIQGEWRTRATQVKSGQRRRLADATIVGFEADMDVFEAALEAKKAEVNVKLGMAMEEIREMKGMNMLGQMAQELQRGIPAPPQQRMISPAKDERDIPLSAYDGDHDTHGEAQKILAKYPRQGGRSAERAFEQRVVAHLKGSGWSANAIAMVLKAVHEGLEENPY